MLVKVLRSDILDVIEKYAMHDKLNKNDNRGQTLFPKCII